MKLCLILIFLLMLPSCAMTRAPSEKLLDKRSDYTGVHQIQEALDTVDQSLFVPARTEPMIADIWVHPHELPSGDYFRGAWIRTVVTHSAWQVEETTSSLIIEKNSESNGASHETK